MSRGSIFILIGFGGMFLLGRFTSPEKIVTVETKVTDKTSSVSSKDKGIIKSRAVLHIATDGSKTMTVDQVIANDLTQSHVDTEHQEETKSKTVYNRSKIELHGFLQNQHGYGLSWGLGASYRILGPISVGAGYMQRQPIMLILGLEL